MSLLNFISCSCLTIIVFSLIHSVEIVRAGTQHGDESLPINSGDLIMRQDAEEMFYSIDVDKYQALGIKCPEPEPPENGFIVGKGTRVGSVLYVHCHEGYRLDGPTVMACVPTSETAQWDPKVRRVCVEGGSYFNEDPSKSDMTESSPQGAPLKHAENRPMEHGFPSFIGPKAHSSWARHHNKPEHEQEEEEIHEEAEEDYDQIPEQCLHKPETGPCRASFKRFYFNKATFECHPFIYGGCLGNQNNFESIEECNLKCLKHE